MSAISEPRIVRRSVGWAVAVSIILIVAGILAILVPPVAGIAVALVVAWLLAFSGAAHLIFAWHMRTRTSLFWQLLLGVVYLAVSFLLFRRPVASLVSLTLLLACYLFVKSILEFVLAFRMRPMPGSGWLFMDAFVALVLSAMIGLTWPWSSEWAIGTLIGVSILFAGITRLSLSLASRRMALPPL